MRSWVSRQPSKSYLPSPATRVILSANPLLYSFEFPLLTSGDHVVEVLLNATTRRDAQDNVIGVVGE